MNFKTFVKICGILNIFTLSGVSANPLVWQFNDITVGGGDIGEYAPPSIDGESVAFSYGTLGSFVVEEFSHPASGSGGGLGAYIRATA